MLILYSNVIITKVSMFKVSSQLYDILVDLPYGATSGALDLIEWFNGTVIYLI